MREERTIAISEKNAEMVRQHLTGEMRYINTKLESAYEIRTKFGKDISVSIKVFKQNESCAELALFKEGNLVTTLAIPNDILGTHVVKDGENEFVVHVKTFEQIDKEEADAASPKMKFYYYNDTQRPVGIHPAMENYGVECDMSTIQHGEVREFLLPKNAVPLLKMWDIPSPGSGLQLLIMPHYDQMS